MRGRVLVVGGGIGGLTAAIALARRGIEVRVLERTPEHGALGAGITLQSNAIGALRTLDLDREIVAAGVVPTEIVLLDPRGDVLSRVDGRSLYRAVGAPSVGIHRAALQRILAAAADRDAVSLGATVAAYETSDGGVTAVLSDGRRVDGDALVGADGIRSAVRERLLGDGAPDYAGYTAWRGIAPFDGISRASETWGVGRRFGIVPVGASQVYWYATANAPAGGGADGAVETLTATFGDWHAPVRALLEATPSGAILRHDVLHRSPAACWGQGRVTLLGDAAHPMTPDLGQGAGQAIEDAVVLAAALAEADDVVSGLRRYERIRVPRANTVVRAAARIGAMGQWDSPTACRLRNTLMKAVPAAVTQRQMAASLRFTVP